MEERTAKIAKRSRIRNAILLALYGGTAVTLAVLAPNAMRLLAYVDPAVSTKRSPTSRIREAAARLEARGLIAKRKTAGSVSYVLTDKGRKQTELLTAIQKVERRPPAWDGRWRIIIFDVWERRRKTRERLRALLENVGFIWLQNSVWVYPYSCEEFVALVRADLRLGNGMIYLIAEGIENDARLKRHFGLP